MIERVRLERSGTPVSRQLRWILAALGLLLLVSPAFGVDTIVVLMNPEPTARVLALEADLRTRSFTLGAPRWSDSRAAVYTANAALPRSDAELFAALDSVRAADGVIAGGELLSDRGGFITFFSGQVLIRFWLEVSDATARGTGASLGLDLRERAQGDPHVFIYDARLRPGALLALEHSAVLFPAIETIRPIVHRLGDPAAFVAPGVGVFHRVPPVRVRLAAWLRADWPVAEVDTEITSRGGSVTTTDLPNVVTAEFASEEEMEKAILALQDLDSVRVAGGLLSSEPLAFLSPEIAVRFVDSNARYQSAATLNAHTAREIRALPYVDNGYLFRLPTAGYDAYALARELIQQGAARYAIPNVVTVNTSECSDDDCGLLSHQDYLELLHVCEPWAAVDDTTGTPVLAVVDEGIQGDSGEPPCDRLTVGTVIDLASMRACHPEDPEDWCARDDPCSTVWEDWSNSHGNKVALTATASHLEDAPDLRGVTTGVELLNAKWPDPWPDVAFADATWWMAGGDPEWCRDGTNYDCTASGPSVHTDECSAPGAVYPCDEPKLPDQLDAARRAALFNLSFSRPRFEEEDCADAAICMLVCEDTDLSNCGVIEGVLERVRHPLSEDTGDPGLRQGGSLVLNAVGAHASVGEEERGNVCFYATGEQVTVTTDWEFHTSLAESPNTVAVGSVYELEPDFWVPYYENPDHEFCLIQYVGTYADVVTPLGTADAGAVLCDSCWGRLQFGASSAATAAVSGIAALMLQFSPDLTADQLHCILRETAQQKGPSGLWKNQGTWAIKDCGYHAKHSACLGYGMADACEAVTAAVACSRTSSECICAAGDDGGGDEEQPGEEEAPDEEPEGEGEDDGKGPWTFDGMVVKLDDLVFPDFLLKLMLCRLDKLCSCRLDPDCMQIDLNNPYEEPIRDVELQLCLGPRCWPMPPQIPVWEPGTTARVRIMVRPEMRGYLSLGAPATIRLLSGGVPYRVENTARPGYP